MQVELIGRTMPTRRFMERTGASGPEDIISYCARISNPENRENFETGYKLLRYCVKKKHWSIFTMGHAIIEVETTRDIGRQVLRHWSLDFQEFSQRYAEVAPKFVLREGRLQDNKNRQNSIETDDDDLKSWWAAAQMEVIDLASTKYREAIERGMAKECARVILPEGNTPTFMTIGGVIRDWFHYCTLRMGNGTQKEHRELASKCFDALKEEFPFLGEIEVDISD